MRQKKQDLKESMDDLLYSYHQSNDLGYKEESNEFRRELQSMEEEEKHLKEELFKGDFGSFVYDETITQEESDFAQEFGYKNPGEYLDTVDVDERMYSNRYTRSMDNY